MSVADLLGSVPVFVLVLFRLAGMMLFAPLFGSAKIPKRVKVMIALVLAMAMTSSLKQRSVVLPETTWGLALGIGSEMAFGLALGMVVSLVFIAAQWAGEIMGQQMGLNMGEVLDPQFGGGASLVGDLYFMLTMMVFLSPLVNGHHALLRGVRMSFDALPLMTASVNDDVLAMLVGLLQSAAALAVQLAAPMLMTMLIVDLSLGCIGKAMPQMNVMAMGLSIRSILGVVVLVLGLRLTGNLLKDIHLEWGDMAFQHWTTPQVAAP
ncbi:MAG: flagellar biosynthetic protein FliR [Anaerolineae bacterium]|nr:flagellar biosynthetic protein FliR [Phycisphaerae bacterium]